MCMKSPTRIICWLPLIASETSCCMCEDNIWDISASEREKEWGLMYTAPKITLEWPLILTRWCKSRQLDKNQRPSTTERAPRDCCGQKWPPPALSSLQSRHHCGSNLCVCVCVCVCVRVCVCMCVCVCVCNWELRRVKSSVRVSRRTAMWCSCTYVTSCFSVSEYSELGIPSQFDMASLMSVLRVALCRPHP